MSGGAFDYRDNVLCDLKDILAREIGLLEYGGADDNYAPKDPRTLGYMKAMCALLGTFGKAMHSLDYYLSGDTGEEKFIADFEKYMDEVRIQKPIDGGCS